LEARVETGARAYFLVTPIMTVAVAAGGTSALSLVSATLASSYAGSGLGFLESCGDNLVRKVEISTEELDPLVGEVPVEIPPVVLLGDVSP